MCKAHAPAKNARKKMTSVRRIEPCRILALPSKAVKMAITIPDPPPATKIQHRIYPILRPGEGWKTCYRLPTSFMNPGMEASGMEYRLGSYKNISFKQ
jgi:hypothetical protein